MGEVEVQVRVAIKKFEYCGLNLADVIQCLRAGGWSLPSRSRLAIYRTERAGEF
jgi:hypothetical protein